MKGRCTNSNDKEWDNYGGRGIRVCERWLNSFEAFYEDMGSRPGSKYSIERDDVNGDYEPGNCRWATPVEQARNKRNNKWITYQGQRMTQTDASRLSGIPLMTIRSRIAKGWSDEEVFAPPLSKPRVANPYGKSFAELDRQWGFKKGTVQDRARRGWSPCDWGNPLMDSVESGKKAMAVRWSK